MASDAGLPKFQIPDAIEARDARPAIRTPQWCVYRAEGPSGPSLVWAFLPAFVKPAISLGDQVDERSIAMMPRLVERIAPVIEQMRLLDRGEQGLSPVDVAVQCPTTGIMWMRTPIGAHSMSLAASGVSNLRAVATRVAASLELMDFHGVHHLDVSPGLIGIDGAGQATLFGFGADIRDLLPESAEDNRALARRGFSPPELWDASGRSPITASSDGYALAATIYCLLVGLPPPDFRTRLHDPDTVARSLRGAIEIALAKNGLEAPALSAALLAALAPVPADRPPSPRAWAETLNIVQRAAPVEPTSIAPTAPAWQALARSRDEPVKVLSRPRRTLSPWVVTTALIFVLAAAAFAVLRTGLWPVAVEPLRPMPRASAIPVPPSAKLAEAKPSVASYPSGRLVGIEYLDDPALVRAGLGQTATIDARRFLHRFREADDESCTRPLIFHIRKDGRGLLISRPAGLVWVTRWAELAPTPVEDRIALIIESVREGDRELEAAGLTGSQRVVELGTAGIGFTLDGERTDEDAERFVACEEM